MDNDQVEQEGSFLKGVLSAIIGILLIVAILVVIFTIVVDVSALYTQSVDLFDNPLDLRYFLKVNLVGVMGLYNILDVYDEAQHI